MEYNRDGKHDNSYSNRNDYLYGDWNKYDDGLFRHYEHNSECNPDANDKYCSNSNDNLFREHNDVDTNGSDELYGNEPSTNNSRHVNTKPNDANDVYDHRRV
jgi:hypothetical protein